MKGKKSQSIYIRLKHSNLDWDKSLNIIVHPDDWDFKKKEIITTKSFNDPIKTERLREVSREVHEISKYLKYEAEHFYYTNTLEVKQWVKDKNRTMWIQRCEKWFKEYKQRNKQNVEPFFMEAFNEAIEILSETQWKTKDTKVRWDDIKKNIQQFMDKKGNLRTDELDLKVWAQMVKFFRNEYVSKKANSTYTKVGLSDYTIKTILKKIRAVHKTLRGHYKFHEDINNFSLELDSKNFDTLTENELERLWNYSGGKYPDKTKKRIWFFMVQYYGCFRISEVHLNLKKYQTKDSRLKTPRELWDEVEMKTNQDGLYYVWNCRKKKTRNNQSVVTKTVPMHQKLLECLFGYMPKDLQDTDKFPKQLMVEDLKIHKLDTYVTLRNFLQDALKELGIEKQISSHEMRKSFITNLSGKNISFADIRNYSGHLDERSLLAYIGKGKNVNTLNNLKSKV